MWGAIVAEATRPLQVSWRLRAYVIGAAAVSQWLQLSSFSREQSIGRRFRSSGAHALEFPGPGVCVSLPARELWTLSLPT